MAETLGMTVTQLKREMTFNEYKGWIAFYAERDRQKEVQNGNLLAMNPEDILGKFNG
jgi:hypothetical protein